MKWKKKKKSKPELRFLGSGMRAHVEADAHGPDACLRMLWPGHTCRMHACIGLLRNPSLETQQAQKTEQHLK